MRLWILRVFPQLVLQCVLEFRHNVSSQCARKKPPACPYHLCSCSGPRSVMYNCHLTMNDTPKDYPFKTWNIPIEKSKEIKLFQFENKKQALKFGFRKDITFSLGFPSFVYIKIVIQTGHVLCITRFPIKNDLNNGNRKLSMKERTFI